MKKGPKGRIPSRSKNTSKGWVWKLYFVVYLFSITINTIHFFAPDSGMNLYYHVLIAYSPYFILPYCFNALSIILNTFSLVPFYLYVYQADFLSLQFWRWIFVFRFAFDIIGRSYEFNAAKSLFYYDIYAGLALLFLAAAINLPSYLAFYKYAFRRNDQKS